ncbi:MAG: hypothetical protein U5L11_07140 [Arhodomonas sp.]|nr:hypothetical protein [Arhodomonas sp.]
MWAYNDPDYLLQIVAWAARDDEVIMHFEGRAISSRSCLDGRPLPIDLDPVSLIVVPASGPHLRTRWDGRCAGREGDPHRWVNPEFHGWWVRPRLPHQRGRGHRQAVRSWRISSATSTRTTTPTTTATSP